MKKINVMLAAAISIQLLAGCSSTPVKLDPVGPALSSTHVPSGWLRVFTATKTVPSGDSTYYYPHTGYRIYTESGKLLEYVPNHIDATGESPTLLQIPAGRYNVLARSEPYNRVIVPIAIQAGKTTEIHLGAHWQAPANVPTNQFVYFPDGRPVGWKSSFAKTGN